MGAIIWFDVSEVITFGQNLFFRKTEFGSVNAIHVDAQRGIIQVLRDKDIPRRRRSAELAGNGLRHSVIRL